MGPSRSTILGGLHLVLGVLTSGLGLRLSVEDVVERVLWCLAGYELRRFVCRICS